MPFPTARMVWLIAAMIVSVLPLLYWLLTSDGVAQFARRLPALGLWYFGGIAFGVWWLR